MKWINEQNPFTAYVRGMHCLGAVKHVKFIKKMTVKINAVLYML